jgi:hypothetical protein
MDERNKREDVSMKKGKAVEHEFCGFSFTKL